MAQKLLAAVSMENIPIETVVLECYSIHSVPDSSFWVITLLFGIGLQNGLHHSIQREKLHNIGYSLTF